MELILEVSIKISVEKVYKVYDDGSGYFIEAGPDLDGLGMISVTTKNDAADFYGKCDLVIDKEMALVLGKTLIEMATDAPDKKEDPM